MEGRDQATYEYRYPSLEHVRHTIPHRGLHPVSYEYRGRSREMRV
jgi:hypothetical protein